VSGDYTLSLAVGLQYYVLLLLTGKGDTLSGVDDLTEMMKNVSQLYSTKGTHSL